MDSALSLLADVGAASVGALWLPVLGWTALVLLAEAALRLGRASAEVGLNVRGSLLAGLPLLLAVAPVLARWVPSLRPAAPVEALPVALVETAAVPAEVGALAALPVEAGPPVLGVVLGVAVVLAVVSAVAALGVLAGGLAWLTRYRRGLGAAPEAARREAVVLAQRLGVRGAVRVVEAEPTSAPFTVGWRRPVVAVPAGLDGEPLRLALAHEIAHVRRSDYGWALAERAVRAVFVWHPLVHVLGRGLALDRERAADAAVLSLWPDRARRYGQLLLSFSTRPAPALALGASTSPLVHRLSAMTSPRPVRRRLARVAGALVLIVPLVAAASFRPDAPPPAPAEATPVETAQIVAPADTLDRHIVSRRLRATDGGPRFEVVLRDGTPRSVAEAIADHYADGGEPGTLVVVGDGVRIERSTLRADVVPPPPPAPPPPAPAPPTAPEAAPAPPAPPSPPVGRTPPAPPAPPTPPTAVAAPPAPPAPPARPADLDEQALARTVEILRAELLAAESALDALGSEFANDPPEKTARRIELRARRDLVRSRFEQAVLAAEQQRLRRVVEEANDGG